MNPLKIVDSFSKLLHRPGGDGGVDLGHEADGLGEGNDDALVVVDVFGGEGATFAVFEPFFADLVAADLEVPDSFGDAAEILLGVDVNIAVEVGDLFDDAGADDGVGGDEVFDDGTFKQVQVNEFFAEGDEAREAFFVGGEGQAGKINFEEFGVAGAVGRRVEDGVGVIEDVFGTEGGFEIALTVGDELEPQFLAELGDEFGGEVGPAGGFGLGKEGALGLFGGGVEIEWKSLDSPTTKAIKVWNILKTS
jgi:hypothetical protein